MERETRGEDSQRDRKAANGYGAECDEHRVRLRAYEIWESESRPTGRALDHWLRARWELRPAPDPNAELERLERELDPQERLTARHGSNTPDRAEETAEAPSRDRSR
jgi:hypothetical protein